MLNEKARKKLYTHVYTQLTLDQNGTCPLVCGFFSINKHSTTWSILVESEDLELQWDDYGTWAYMDFGIHGGSWNQAPTDTKGGIYECVCIQFRNATHIKMTIQPKVSRNSCLYVAQWLLTNLVFVIMKVPQSMENCDSFPLSLCL